MKIILIHNPDAGDDAQPSGDQIARLMPKARNKESYFASKDKKWKKAQKKPGDFVAFAGGDGTFVRIARRLNDSRTPIAVLPMGTANNIANTIGVTGRKFE